MVNFHSSALPHFIANVIGGAEHASSYSNWNLVGFSNQQSPISSAIVSVSS